MLKIGNNHLNVLINALGAELKSVVGEGFEYIWQANAGIWGRSAPVLFPVVGKPFNNTLLIHGKTYPMPQHGFARDQEFEVIEKSETHLLLRLVPDESALQQYPYHFELRLGYTLVDHTIGCSYEVRNTGTEALFFSIGAHPGFNLPSKKLADYFLEFEYAEDAERYLLTDGLLNGDTEPVLQNSRVMLLGEHFFEKDAIVLKQMRSREVFLKGQHTSFSIGMKWDDFPYLGIWCKKNCEDFICIEPWCGIAGSVGEQVAIEQKEGINLLEPGGVFKRNYFITFNR